ncbi:MAG: SurA N-terminal domain-containing protein [Oceanospirillaceae bacterium]|nr:SurA N-terminal domain-containing protein [Oceanospirillaceae bacterium]
MLQGIRDNSKGLVAKVIVGFIVLTFAMFGIDSLVGLTQGSNAPASVNGEDISEQDLYQATQLQRRSILAQMGANADPSSLDDNLLRGMVLESLIQEKALLVEADQNDMLVSNKMIDKIIASTPAFQVDGKFSALQFDSAIRNIGFTRLSYRESIRKQLVISQQRAGLSLSSYVLPSSLKQVVALERQARDIRYFSMPIETVRALTSVTDDEVKAEFEATKNSLNTEEEVIVKYVRLAKEDLISGVDISADKIDEQYQQIVASFEAKAQRQVSHILIEVTDEVNDAAALEKIIQIKARLAAGEDFASVAKETSNDFGSADSGGDLGVVDKGTFEAAFEDELFSLEQGVVSEPVKSESGYHLIKVVSITETAAPSLEDSKAQIIAELTESEAEQLYLEKLEKLTDLAFISGDLTDLAAELELEIKTSAAFSRAGATESELQSTKIVREAFSDELIKDELNSAPVELSRTSAIVLRVVEHLPVRSKTFEEVSALIELSLLTAKASKALTERAKLAVEEIKNSGDASVVAADFELKTQLNAARYSAEVPREVLRKAFALAHPEAGKVSVDTVTLADSSLAIVIVDKIIAADLSKISEQEMQAIAAALSERTGRATYDIFVSQVREAAEVERL